jgi:colicin import membrane protein
MAERVRQYALPMLLALLLHAVAALGLYGGWHPQQQETRVIRPQIVQAQLIMMEQQAPKATPKPAPQPQPKPQPKPEPKPQPKPEPKPEPKPQPKPEPVQPKPQPDAEAERRRAEERARQERLEALAQSSFLEALQSEATDLAQADADAEEAAAQSYRMGIYQMVVANWSRPPSARNRMEAKLLVELVPTGDVVGVTVLESSGDAAFDRSAEAAVRKARRFEVPKESAMFERYFRRFTLLFRPEDLLR